MTTHQLDPERYLALIDADTERLITLGERGLKIPIPCLDGWDVAEVLWHVAGVYEHKVRVMADNAWPEPWPPAHFEDKDEIEFLREAQTDLFEEFSRHDPAEQTTTFGADTTIAFWMRRMALEVAVHRYDAELAHADTTPIPDDESLDGIDELLRLMLEADESEGIVTRSPVDALVAVESAGRRWLCDARADALSVSDDMSTPATATVSGQPMTVFLWLWGREPDESVERSGSLEIMAEFRNRITECTQ
ncbi:MAG: maleylpyruvate isomerase N-terminal domain-containing protein [Propionibacteriales bacterium]|nr:maleylpyruvate isomerase N-terminal domain-containing protein [Propionibacteriales bacterium]